MGAIYTTIRIENAADMLRVEADELAKEEARFHEVESLVDTGAQMLHLPQDLVDALGLRERRRVTLTYADERKETRPVAGPLVLHIKGRFMFTECAVMPPESEPIVGQLVLEELDLVADCLNRTVKVRPEAPHHPSLKAK